MATFSSAKSTFTQLPRLLLTAALLLPAGLVTAQDSELTYDNLEPVENPRLAMYGTRFRTPRRSPPCHPCGSPGAVSRSLAGSAFEKRSTSTK